MPIRQATGQKSTKVSSAKTVRLEPMCLACGCLNLLLNLETYLSFAPSNSGRSSAKPMEVVMLPQSLPASYTAFDWLGLHRRSDRSALLSF